MSTQAKQPVITDEIHPPYQVIQGDSVDAYQEKVVYTYNDSPEDWRKAIGDRLMFQFGIYKDPQSPISPDESGLRYFDQQMALAGYDRGDFGPVKRILDVGCGWGFGLKYLAERFPACPRLDGINVSQRQLEYCTQYHAEHGLSERINLYLCNAQDIDLLPGADEPYDLVTIRGVISHFPNDLYKRAMAKLAARLRPGATVIISDNLYNLPIDQYQSDTSDEVDRLACKHRKTPEYFRQVIEQSGLSVEDMRVLPENIDVARWFMDVKKNIEANFTAQTIPPPLEELRVMAVNVSVALIKNQFSTYSVIARNAT
ncbi:Cyclopropane fatty-acyl-phospholipid synthase [Pseudomonas grimontii]|uniref:Cyclopropane fatty-acyl-phospholipid synthase n=1 Tax=Pseudomonas grimontii TaxID=129847 RepID=A0ABY0TUX0_9PSED|nr:class I SAM-dependent methyltransferase [Pseudomonas grimontii]SDR39430.1 Cyclopropane fatty-acyl-phospholipid synthase [Pseudomonas grimontii]